MYDEACWWQTRLLKGDTWALSITFFGGGVQASSPCLPFNSPFPERSTKVGSVCLSQLCIEVFRGEHLPAIVHHPFAHLEVLEFHQRNLKSSKRLGELLERPSCLNRPSETQIAKEST